VAKKEEDGRASRIHKSGCQRVEGALEGADAGR
jgi:hypothetical protein